MSVESVVSELGGWAFRKCVESGVKRVEGEVAAFGEVGMGSDIATRVICG
jgi:hypothetical protein